MLAATQKISNKKGAEAICVPVFFSRFLHFSFILFTLNLFYAHVPRYICLRFFINYCKRIRQVYTMKTKKLSVFFLIGLFLLMLFSPETVATGAANGLLLWYRQVLPVLFPFLLITGLLIRTESISLINHALFPILKPFLGISEKASFSVVCGFLCGFPVGAKSCSDLTDKGEISSAEGEYLLSFCNNVSPAFLTGYVAVQSLKQPEMAQICLLFPILAALCCSFLFRRWYLPRNPFAVVEEQADPRQFLPFSEALDESILSACDSITKIGGYMIVFSVLISFMAELSFQNFFWKLLLLPGVELTGGIRMLCQLDLTSELRFLLIMAHCSFGGVCALFQTKCMIRSQNWSFPRYIAEKLITAMVTSLFACCYMKLFG